MSRLYLIGVGPGDPELLTLKAARLIGEADVIAYPQKPGEPSLAHTIAQAHISASATHMPIELPMQVDRAPAQAAYDKAAKAIQAQLSQGQTIAYLCEGDPLFYGSATYLLARLSGADISIVPGITSVSAAAAATLHPLATRNQIIKIVPAPLDEAELIAALDNSDPIALIKIGRHLDKVRKALHVSGRTGATLIAYASDSERQTIIPLDEFDLTTAPYFSLILCDCREEEQL